ncbi:Uncharacterized protein OBRU01_13904, partial [Operophtera brumata]
MDLKGSLVDTRLRIYPTDSLLAFLKTLTNEDEIPANILKAIGEDAKKPTDFVTSTSVQFTRTDLENLNKIKKVVEDKFKTETENIKQDIPDPKLKDKIDTKNSDEGIEVEEKATEKTDEKSKDEIKKTPFRSTSDIDWQEVDNKPIENKDDKLIDEIVPVIPYLTTSDIDWLYNYLQNQKSNNQDVPYLHDLLAGANIEVPENSVIKRNPVLEARCVKLRKQQEAREYRKMTKTVDNVRLRFPEDSISYQMKQLNRQLIAIGQFILSIFADTRVGSATLLSVLFLIKSALKAC